MASTACVVTVHIADLESVSRLVGAAAKVLEGKAVDWWRTNAGHWNSADALVNRADLIALADALDALTAERRA